MSISASTLLIDVGNTRIKFAQLDSTGIIHELGACDTQSNEQTILSFLSQCNQSWRHAWGVCVASNEILVQLNAVLKSLHIDIHWLSGSSPLVGLRNDYATPHTLGADRWLAAYGVIQMRQHNFAPCVLATFGTATTVDLIEWDNTHECHVFVGGIIFAGLSTAWKSVSQQTAHLPDVSHFAHELRSTDPIPNRTHTALQLGTIYSQIGAIEHFMTHVAARGLAPELLLAGGDASVMKPFFRHAAAVNHPVFLGLAHASTFSHTSFDNLLP